MITYAQTSACPGQMLARFSSFMVRFSTGHAPHSNRQCRSRNTHPFVCSPSQRANHPTINRNEIKIKALYRLSESVTCKNKSFCTTEDNVLMSRRNDLISWPLIIAIHHAAHSHNNDNPNSLYLSSRLFSRVLKRSRYF